MSKQNIEESVQSRVCFEELEDWVRRRSKAGFKSCKTPYRSACAISLLSPFLSKVSPTCDPSKPRDEPTVRCQRALQPG